MLLSGVLFVLFLAGCWLYCLADAALTPAVEYRGLSKSTWIYIISATFIVGALAWLIARRSRRRLAHARGHHDRQRGLHLALPVGGGRRGRQAPGRPCEAAIPRPAARPAGPRR